MRAAGVQVLAFDHKASPSFPTQLLDLTSPEHQDALCEIIVDNASRLQHIHIAPPCGTCSAKAFRLKSSRSGRVVWLCFELGPRVPNWFAFNRLRADVP